jgi:hypothetical protein
LALGLE